LTKFSEWTPLEVNILGEQIYEFKRNYQRSAPRSRNNQIC
jgi:hypothetical protein